MTLDDIKTLQSALTILPSVLDELKIHRPDLFPRKKIILTSPWDGKNIEEQDLEIDCAGLNLIAKGIVGQNIELRNCVIYNYGSLYESWNTGLNLKLLNCQTPDLVRLPDNSLVRTNTLEGTLVEPAGKRYGVYAEAKQPGTLTPIPDLVNNVLIENCTLGSSAYEHPLRTHFGTAIVVKNSTAINRANLAKGDHRNGGSALRLHGHSATLLNSTFQWYTKVGHAQYHMRRLLIDGCTFKGGFEYEGVTQQEILNSTLNGLRM